jgi:adenylate cyclase
MANPGFTHANRRRFVWYGALWLAALLLTRLLEQAGLVAPLELAVGDYWHRLAGNRQAVRHVSLVVIDDATLAAYKQDPLVFWTPHVAKAVQVLREAGAAVVGLDLLFSISPESWLDRYGHQGSGSNFDVPLRQEIASGQLVMVASTLTGEAGDSQFLLPASEFLLAVPEMDLTRHVGLADLLSDADGVTRRFVVAPALRLPDGTDASGMPRLTFAALLAARASNSGLTLDAAGKEHVRLGGRDYALAGADYPIAFPGPPGQIPRVPFATLLQPDALNRPEVQALHGRVVIIGGEYAGMNDTHATPYVSGFFQGDGRYMSGPEVHGAIVETLLSGRLPQPLPPWAETLLTGLALLVALLLFLKPRLALAVLVLPLLAGLTTILAYALFLRDLLFPLMALIAGMTLLLLGVIGLRYLLEERERNRITRMFGRYVSEGVVAELIASGQAPQLGGVRRTLTLLFSDIRNFTVISERLTAEEVVEMLNRYFALVCQAVLDQGGTIDKFIGDAIMVQFGAPLSYADHADRALRSALRIQGIAEEFAGWMRERFADRDLPGFAVGIGVHTGPVVIGNIGSEQRTEYTAIGDTVNAASRIEGMTKEWHCTVLASEETLRACTAAVVTGRSQAVQVKGKSEPLLLHEILGLK